MKKLKRKHVKEVKRFTQYMMGGGVQFWSGYAAFAAFDLIFHMPFWPARVISYAVGISLNFFIERFWVFKTGRKLAKRQLGASAQRYYILMVIDFILDQAIVGGLRAAGLTPYLGQFVSAGFFTVWNYLLFKLWVFQTARRKRYA
jgi:putative flippase GtrA